jgi:hypothetical protein
MIESKKLDSGTEMVHDMYVLEKKARAMELPPELIYEERLQKSKLIVDQFKTWLDELAPTVVPKSIMHSSLTIFPG